MSTRVKSRVDRRAGHQVKEYKGCVLTRVGSQTVEVAMPGRAVLDWAASWRQARRVVNWIPRPSGRDTDE
jgi:hypothetical protein